MRGVLLAGGTGSRLRPLTEVTNKHLLPIGNKIMLEWPLGNLIECGCKDIMVITGHEHAGAIFQYLGSGERWNVNFTFRVQEEPKGIAHALSLARDFCHGQEVMMILGDNIFQDNLAMHAEHFLLRPNVTGAMILVKEVEDPNRFGVVEINDGIVTKIEEKPVHPKTNLVQTGAYFYDKNVFEYISRLKPSNRGEIEVTSLNMEYVKAGLMMYSEIDGWWTDAGTIDTLQIANLLVSQR